MHEATKAARPVCVCNTCRKKGLAHAPDEFEEVGLEVLEEGFAATASSEEGQAAVAEEHSGPRLYGAKSGVGEMAAALRRASMWQSTYTCICLVSSPMYLSCSLIRFSIPSLPPSLTSKSSSRCMQYCVAADSRVGLKPLGVSPPTAASVTSALNCTPKFTGGSPAMTLLCKVPELMFTCASCSGDSQLCALWYSLRDCRTTSCLSHTWSASPPAWLLSVLSS